MSEEVAAEFLIEQPNINIEYDITSNPLVDAEYNITEPSAVELEFEIADNNTIISDFSIANEVPIKTVFEIKAAGTVWGSITGDIPEQEDLQNALNEKADVSYVAEEINRLNSEIENKVETVNGSELIGVSRENNAVTITSKTFVFEQAIPATKWVINHNLNKRPSIDLTYYNGDRFEAYKKYVNNNQVVIFHKNPIVGFAYLN